MDFIPPEEQARIVAELRAQTLASLLQTGGAPTAAPPPHRADVYDLEEGLMVSRFLIDARQICKLQPERFTMSRPDVWPPDGVSPPAKAEVVAEPLSGSFHGLPREHREAMWKALHPSQELHPRLGDKRLNAEIDAALVKSAAATLAAATGDTPPEETEAPPAGGKEADPES